MKYLLLIVMLFCSSIAHAGGARTIPGTTYPAGDLNTNHLTINNVSVPTGRGEANILVGFGTERGNSNPAAGVSVTWRDRTLLFIGEHHYSQSSRSQYVAFYYLPNAPRGSTGAIDISLNNPAVQIDAVARIVDGTQAPADIRIGEASGTTVSTSLTTVLPGSLIVDVMNSGIPATYQTTEPNQSVVAHLNALGQATTALSERIAGPGMQAVGWKTPTLGARLAQLAVVFPPLTEDYFPPDHGMIDIQTNPNCPNLVGDGVTDDTVALQNCITYWTDHDQFLTGIFKETSETLCSDKEYLVSGPIQQIGADGGERAYLTFSGCKPGRPFQITLKENSFTDPNIPQIVLRFGNPGANGAAARNNLNNVKVRMKSGNFGAIGIKYIANNMAFIQDTIVTSDDHQCVAGMMINDKFIGPFMVDNLFIDGCKRGLNLDFPYSGATFEHLTVQNQNEYGVYVNRFIPTFKDFVSNQVGNVPAMYVYNDNNQGAGPMIAVLNASLNSSGSTGPAIYLFPKWNANRYGQGLFRNINTSGYATAINSNGTLIAGPHIDEFVTNPINEIFPSIHQTLNLPIPDHPKPIHPFPDDWKSITEFGAIQGDGLDDANAIQDTIDSGHKVVFAPAGRWALSHKLILRGAIERFVCYDTFFIAQSGFRPSPIMETDVTLDHDVSVEGCMADRGDRTNSPFPEPRFRHNSAFKLVLTNLLHFGKLVTMAGSGQVLVKDWCCDELLMNFTDLVGRNINVESAPTPNSGDPTGKPDVECVGADCVIVGMKTENNEGPFVRASEHSRLEVLNMFNYCSTGGTILPPKAPVAEIIESEAALSITAQSGCGWDPLITVIRLGISGSLRLDQQNTVRSRKTMIPLFVERPIPQP